MTNKSNPFVYMHEANSQFLEKQYRQFLGEHLDNLPLEVIIFPLESMNIYKISLITA